MIPLKPKICSSVTINPIINSLLGQIQFRNNHKFPYKPINFSSNRHNPDQVHGIYLQVYQTRGIKDLQAAVVQEKIKNYSKISSQDLQKIYSCNSSQRLQRELLFEKLTRTK